MADELVKVPENVYARLIGGRDAKAVGTDGFGVSTQIKDPFDELYSGDDAVRPTYNLAELALYGELNATLAAAIDAIVTNVVRHGFKFVPANADVKPDAAGPKKELALLAALFPGEEGEIVVDPRQRLPFVEIAARWYTDYMYLGNGFLEVLRNRKVEVDGFVHLPGHTVRVRRSGGFVQIRGSKKVYFKEFGDERKVDYRTGDEKEDTPPQFLANEIIHILQYSPRSDYYGVPRHVASIPAILGSREAAEYNYYFFCNNGVPRFAVIVSGGRLAADSEKYIREYLEANTRGVTNAHKVLVLEATVTEQVAARFDNRVTIKLQPLTVGVTEDASFLKYRQANDDEIRGVYRLHPIFVGQVQDVNRANAIEARKLGEEQVFGPLRRTLNYVLNATVVAGMGIENWRFQFVGPELGDPTEQADEIARIAGAGGYTINDIRREVGMDAIAAPWADMPLPIALLQLQLGGAAFDESGKGLRNAIANIKTQVVDELARRAD